MLAHRYLLQRTRTICIVESQQDPEEARIPLRKGGSEEKERRMRRHASFRSEKETFLGGAWAREDPDA